MTNYFATSEQVETKIKLASDESGVGGLMLQKMPLLGGKALPEDFDEEGWQRLKIFADTVKSEELLTLDPEEINRRLFWEEFPERHARSQARIQMPLLRRRRAEHDPFSGPGGGRSHHRRTRLDRHHLPLLRSGTLLRQR